MSTGDIHVNQTASDSSNVTQIGVQYTGGIHQHYAPGSEPKRTTVTLDLGLEQVDVSKLIALISGLTKSGVQDINLVGVRLGSLIVTLEMPSEAAYTLGQLALTRPELFAEFMLRSISVDLPPPSGAAVAGQPKRPSAQPRKRSSPFRALGNLLKGLILLTGIVVAAVAIILIIWLLQHPPGASACLLTSIRGNQPIFAGPSARQQAIGEYGEDPGVEVIGQLEGGGWWQVRLPDGREGWVPDRAINLSGECQNIPLLPGSGGALEPCTATVIWPGGPSRLSGALREGPSPNFPIVTTLQEGVPVVLLERTDDFAWWHVINEEAPAEGWMPQSSLALVGACDAIPAVPPG
jgi:uncharacterized protein YraI